MLDNGNTGPLRQLYITELIARFGHHLGLSWNLGEENGPAPWSPNAQNNRQRKDMASYLKVNDPYNHPVMLHTHSEDPDRSNILDSLLQFKDLDGISLQQAERKEAAKVVQDLREKSITEGHEWMINMDEIGKWHTGALPDSLDPNHDTLRKYVLWGTLMSGAAGIEWYFGANTAHNDLTSEDWRKRDKLWQLTHHALQFFENNLPYWEMKPAHHLLKQRNAYCFQKPGEVYAIYFPNTTRYSVFLKNASDSFTVQWFNPLTGGDLTTGSIEKVNGGKTINLGRSPAGKKNQDWVVLLKKTPNK